MAPIKTAQNQRVSLGVSYKSKISCKLVAQLTTTNNLCVFIVFLSLEFFLRKITRYSEGILRFLVFFEVTTVVVVVVADIRAHVALHLFFFTHMRCRQNFLFAAMMGWPFSESPKQWFWHRFFCEKVSTKYISPLGKLTNRNGISPPHFQ